MILPYEFCCRFDVLNQRIRNLHGVIEPEAKGAGERISGCSKSSPKKQTFKMASIWAASSVRPLAPPWMRIVNFAQEPE
jgi:hypothetical protein